MRSESRDLEGVDSMRERIDEVGSGLKNQIRRQREGLNASA